MSLGSVKSGLVGALFILGCVTAVESQPLPLESKTPVSDEAATTFRGLRFGIDIRTQIRECKHTGPPERWTYETKDDRTCWQGTVPMLCRDKRFAASEFGPVRACGIPVYATFHDSLSTRLWSLQVDQIDGKLEHLRGFIKTADFAYFMELLTEKYGAPFATGEEAWQSKGGVRMVSKNMIWKYNGLSIALTSLSYDVDHGSLDVATQRFTDAVRARGAGEKQRNINDL